MCKTSGQKPATKSATGAALKPALNLSGSKGKKPGTSSTFELTPGQIIWGGYHFAVFNNLWTSNEYKNNFYEPTPGTRGHALKATLGGGPNTLRAGANISIELIRAFLGDVSSNDIGKFFAKRSTQKLLNVSYESALFDQNNLQISTTEDKLWKTTLSTGLKELKGICILRQIPKGKSLQSAFTKVFGGILGDLPGIGLRVVLQQTATVVSRYPGATVPRIVLAGFAAVDGAYFFLRRQEEDLHDSGRFEELSNSGEGTSGSSG